MVRWGVRNSLEMAKDAGGFPTLTELANRFGTDKGTSHGHAHHYTLVYDALFEPLRVKPVRVLEIGLLIGGPEHGNFERRVARAPSVLVWLNYFGNGVVFGFDHSDFSHLASERFRFVRGDCGSEADLERLADVVPKLDIIIDDASHASYHQQLAFRYLFPRLKPGGLYIIEDLFWQSPIYEAELPFVGKSRNVFHRIFTSQAPFCNAVFSERQVEEYRRQISAFAFFGWLGGPVRPSTAPELDPVRGVKLLVMRRMSD